MALEVIILAAGQGTRMKSALPKVLHPLAGTPLLQHVITSAQNLAPLACHVVVGFGGDQVQQELQQAGVNWVQQTEQLGTGHAVLQALPALADDSTVLVLYGDVPLLATDTLRELLQQAQSGPALLTARLQQPTGYGRIVRDEAGALVAVVEEKDADQQQRALNEVNSGVLAVPVTQLRNWLPQVKNDNKQGEYYLPDILALAVAAGVEVKTTTVQAEIEILGVNDRAQLNQVEREFQRRQAHALMAAGATLADANRLEVRGELQLGQDVFIDINAVFEGVIKLGDNVRIGANCVLNNVEIAAGAELKPFCHLDGVKVGPDCIIGPFARLRPGTTLARDVRIGNFVETKQANIGAGSKVNHLTYIGDCEMGAGVNVGAGTITCNYDGANKYQTNIGDGAFIGSNSTLVAPVVIADGGYVGAGSTITRQVDRDELAISRGRQRNLTGWQRPSKDKS